MSGRVLVVNADDFGLTPGVCGAILRAHRDGVVTATSALVVAPAFAAHAASLRDSGLGVGIHLCLVGEDPPLLGPREIPSLVDDRGRFAPDWRSFVVRSVSGRIDGDDVAREFEAQLDALGSHGLVADHVDTHQNLHLWPSVRRRVLEVAHDRGIGAIRATSTRRWSPTSWGVRVLSRGLRRAATADGLAMAAGSAGLDEAGHLTVDAMASTIDLLAATPGSGPLELACHPGEQIDPDRDRYRWGYAWPDELDALCSPTIRDLVAGHGLRLGDYTDLAEASRPSTLP